MWENEERGGKEQLIVHSESVSQFAPSRWENMLRLRGPAHLRNVHHINILIAFSTYFMSQYTHRTENSPRSFCAKHARILKGDKMVAEAEAPGALLSTTEPG